MRLDVAFLLGVLVALAGVAMLSVPLAAIVAGTLVAAASWLAHQAQGRASVTPGQDDRA